MTKFFPALAVCLAFFGCTHSPEGVLREDDAQISRFDQPAAESRLAETKQAIKDVDEQLRTSQNQLDQFELQAAKETGKEDAVEGARAEIAALQAKRGGLEHRQHLLEARLRELGWQR